MPHYNFNYRTSRDAIDGEHVLHCGLAVVLAIVLADATVKACGWIGYWMNLGY